MSIFYEKPGLGSTILARRDRIGGIPQGEQAGKAGWRTRSRRCAMSQQEGERMWRLLDPFSCGMTDPPADPGEPADFPCLSPLEDAGFTGRPIEQFVGRNFLRGLRAGWH